MATTSTTTFPWAALVRDVVAAAVIALVIGTLCYHFLADQGWSSAFAASLPWAALAIVGAGVGHAIAHLARSRSAGRTRPKR